jgi:hypothetical protein
MLEVDPASSKILFTLMALLTTPDEGHQIAQAQPGSTALFLCPESRSLREG